MQMTRAEKAEHWAGVIEQRAASGLSISAYCREHDLGEWQFHYWKRRLREPADGGFVELTSSGGGADAGVRISHNGYEIVLGRDFDVPTLRRVLQVL
jgi:transposase-like protein